MRYTALWIWLLLVLVLPVQAQESAWRYENGVWNLHGQVSVKLPQEWQVELSGEQLFCRGQTSSRPFLWIGGAWGAEDTRTKRRAVQAEFNGGTTGLLSSGELSALYHTNADAASEASAEQLEEVIESLTVREEIPELPSTSADKSAKIDLPTGLRDALSEPKTGTLYSLHPDWSQERPGPLFHKFQVLGAAELGSEETKELASTLLKGIDASKDMLAAACFDPRHGLAIGEYDLVICFECARLQVHFKGELLEGFALGIGGKLFEDAVRRHGLAWPGWRLEGGNLCHATGVTIAWRPLTGGAVTHDYRTDRYRFTVEKYPAKNPTATALNPKRKPLPNGEVETEPLTLSVSAEDVSRVLSVLLPEVKVLTDIERNTVCLRGAPESVRSGLEIVAEAEQPNSVTTSVDIQPISGREEALKQLARQLETQRKLNRDFKMSQSTSSRHESVEYRFQGVFRGPQMLSEEPTLLTLGCVGQGHSYLVYSAVTPTSGGDSGLLKRVLSCLTFSQTEVVDETL